MFLADKIINLRKKAGWSQEELAGRLGVTRQSVSKWEGAQSVPDIEKIVQLSRLFSVTTDYLLKDELEEPEPVLVTDAGTQENPEKTYRRVTMEEASAYMKLEREDAPKKALATCLWVSSPIALILLASMSEYARFGINENAAAAIGLCVLILFVAIGVVIYTSCSEKEKDYAFLEKEPFETEYGVIGPVRARKNYRNGLMYFFGYAALWGNGTGCRRYRFLCGGLFYAVCDSNRMSAFRVCRNDQ